MAVRRGAHLHVKTPSAGTPVTLFDLICSATSREDCEAFQLDLGTYLGATHCALAGSGTSAFYAILLALKDRSGAREVVLPAYTAPSLVLPIVRAGLRPVLAETSKHSLNADTDALLARVGSETLVVVPVHMFGLATDVHRLREALPDNIWVVEDACSSLGTRVGGKQAGTWGHIGFYSFNRGKNLSTLSGGAVSTDDGDIARSVDRQISTFRMPGRSERLKKVALSAALAMAVRPLGYTALYPLIARHKYTRLHTDFDAYGYTPYQAALGRRILSRFDTLCESRRNHTTHLRERLSSVKGVELPRILRGSEPVLNQFPIRLPDSKKRDNAHDEIVKTGLEATRLYPDPVHRVYDTIWDGVGPDPYPEATQISEQLLLLPVHPMVSRKTLDRALDTLIDVACSGQTEKALTR